MPEEGAREKKKKKKKKKGEWKEKEPDNQRSRKAGLHLFCHWKHKKFCQPLQGHYR